MPGVATVRRLVLILSLASVGVCWGAGQALVVHDGTAGLEADVLANLTDSLTAAGDTVTSSVGVPPGPLASTADTISADVKTLRKVLQCPADAG